MMESGKLDFINCQESQQWSPGYSRDSGFCISEALGDREMNRYYRRSVFSSPWICNDI
jgi:hypothetical protein